MAGLHVFGIPTVDLRGPSRYSRRSSSDWHGNGGRLSTSGGKSSNRSSDRYRTNRNKQFQVNYRQNNYNAKP